MRNMKRRAQVALAGLSIGGSILVLEGCDPAARDTILGGVEGSATSLITSFVAAFFETIRARAADDDNLTTVRATREHDVDRVFESSVFA